MTRGLVSTEDVRRAEDELKQAEAEIEESIVSVRAFVNYHGEMSRTYRRAASRPWVRVDPDPPPPEP